jgi:molecular chaperone GrpE (heat shock protein)
MASDRKPQAANSIPIRFVDDSEFDDDENEMDALEPDPTEDIDEQQGSSESRSVEAGGPELAELVALRAELKRLQSALAESQDAVARRQADFENYRKRVERERTETYNRMLGELVQKLLPVVDNLGRALDAERSLEASESKEFRHFLSGVELIANSSMKFWNRLELRRSLLWVSTLIRTFTKRWSLNLPMNTNLIRWLKNWCVVTVSGIACCVRQW